MRWKKIGNSSSTALIGSIWNTWPQVEVCSQVLLDSSIAKVLDNCPKYLTQLCIRITSLREGKGSKMLERYLEKWGRDLRINWEYDHFCFLLSICSLLIGLFLFLFFFFFCLAEVAFSTCYSGSSYSYSLCVLLSLFSILEGLFCLFCSYYSCKTSMQMTLWLVFAFERGWSPSKW